MQNLTECSIKLMNSVFSFADFPCLLTLLGNIVYNNSADRKIYFISLMGFTEFHDGTFFFFNTTIGYWKCLTKKSGYFSSS